MKLSKTYITAAIAILTAWSAYVSGEASLTVALQTTFGALLAAFVRDTVVKNGINGPSGPLVIAALLSATLVLPSCAAVDGRPGVSLDAIDGVCVLSADGRYAACYNPLSKVTTVRSTAPDGRSTSLAYDPHSKSWRGQMADGSTAVYAGGRLHIEPPLPVKPDAAK